MELEENEFKKKKMDFNKLSREHIQICPAGKNITRGPDKKELEENE
jgi:hypothetical protein